MLLLRNLNVNHDTRLRYRREVNTGPEEKKLYILKKYFPHAVIDKRILSIVLKQHI